MQVQFRTKEEANMEQERDFLKLTPIERVYRFLDVELQHNVYRLSARSIFRLNFYKVKKGKPDQNLLN